MSRKKAKPGKLRGFGLSAAADEAPAMGYQGPEQAAPPTSLWDEFTDMMPGIPRQTSIPLIPEPMLRRANVLSLVGGVTLQFFGVKNALTWSFGLNLVDILGRQLSPDYRAKIQLGAWNVAVM